MLNNSALKTLFVFNGIFVFAANLLGPLFAIYVERLGVDVFGVSLSWASFLVSSVVFTYLISLFGDRIREKEYLLMAGYLIRSVVWISYIFVGQLYLLILLQVILGVGEAFGTPAFDAIFAEHLDNNHHIREYADWKIVSNILSAVAIITGGMIAINFGFNLVFILMSVLSMFSFASVLLISRRVL